jgi:capsular exopolysaccharide synthesis family protein
VEPLEYLRVLRRRKLFVALAVLVGVVAGWVSAPGTSTPEVPKYRAVHTLILNPQIATKAFNLDQAAVLVTTGAIPQAVAAKVGPGTDPIRLAKKITSKSNTSLGTIDITATDTDPNFAVALADDFAQGLVDDLSRAGLQHWQDQHDQLTKQVNDLRDQVAALDGTFDPRVSSPAKSQYDALNSQYTSTQARLLALDATGPPPDTFTTLQPARAVVVSSSGLKPPDSKPARAALLGGIGLLLGIGLAFAAERLETKLTTKISTEQAFGLPVVAEIPNLPNAKRHRDELMTATQPSAPFVEAHRGLRTIVLLKALDQAHRDGGAAEGTTGGKVLVIVSPGAGEGKTTTAAHLAALLAEAGHSVLVVSADFRRPRVHELFAVDSAPGLSEVLAPHNPMPLRSLDLSTPVKGVKLLASGTAVDNPAPLLNATVELMRGARPLFDFIVVDTAPLLVANDASELIRAADMVLVVARSRKTSIDACARAAELLKRIDAPVTGVVLVGASDMPAAYRYYRYRYYAASTPPTLTQRLRGGNRPKNRRGDRQNERDLRDERDRRDERSDRDDASTEPRGQRRRQREERNKKSRSRRGASVDAVPADTEPAAPVRADAGPSDAQPDFAAADSPETNHDHEPVTEVPSYESAYDRPAGDTNGSSDFEITDESLSEFWQEFKERQ